MKQAQARVNEGTLSKPLLSRLSLQGAKFDQLLQGIIDVTLLRCPTGQTTLARRLDEELELFRITCPIGVLLVIFESRPEVVVNISCLAIFSGNAVILKGGKEASHSNKILSDTLQDALLGLGSKLITPPTIQLIQSREDVGLLLTLEKYVDLVIPRGGKALVQYVQANTRIPVLGHADGICSIYIDSSADKQKAVNIIVDSKTNYPAACNSVETLLINSNVEEVLLVDIAHSLCKAGVHMRCCDVSFNVLSKIIPTESISRATAADFDTEFLELIIAIRMINSPQEAIEHINQHGSHHTDCIVTESKEIAEEFMSSVDSAGVYWNASTRFADGFRYGYGAEIGVSTNKTHARGPVGLEGLVIYKYHLYGNGQYVGQYGVGKKKYLHAPIMENI